MLSALRTKFSLVLKELSSQNVRHEFEMNLEYNTDIIKLKMQLKNGYNLFVFCRKPWQNAHYSLIKQHTIFSQTPSNQSGKNN